MSIFRYNSKHKIIVGGLIIFWAAYSFSGKRNNDTYNKDGKLLQTGNFKEGKNHGKWIWFYENGNKKLEGAFNMGNREGEWISYDTNGDTLSKSNYINDKLNGSFVHYNKGNPLDTSFYINDNELKR